MTAPHVVILADDLTGAAEIAGIAADRGMQAAVRRETGGDGPCVAYDTHTRHLRRHKAAARVETFAAHAPRFDLLFKKTDSVLRGNVAAEIAALLRRTGQRRAILLPQNPSKGRVIVEGKYHIDGVPLHETDFRNDPDHPCTTHAVIDLLTDDACPVSVVPVGGPLPAEGIIVGSAATEAHVAWWAAQVSDDLLAAGGADFFAAILQYRGLPRRVHACALAQTPALIVCGSATASSRHTVRQWRAAGLPVCPVPDFAAGSDPSDTAIEACATLVAQSLRERGIAIIAATQDVDRRQAPAIRTAMAQLLHSIMPRIAIPRLVIEGGATAAAIVEALAWREFAVEGSLAPGVVALRPAARPDTQLIIKPGSYPWGILDIIAPQNPQHP